MSEKREAFIVDTCRTPRAKRKGVFSGIHPIDLMTYPLNGIVERNKISPESIEDVILGCVTQTGEQGWCVARGAVLGAGWPISVPGTTINRLCGSGQQATNFGASTIQAGNADLIVSGGLEHMTRVPMFSDTGGEPSPALNSHHPDLVQQGESAEIMAEEFKLSREEIDAFALSSQMKAKEALDNKRFQGSLIPVSYQEAESGQSGILEADNNPRPETTAEALAGLKTVFRDNGVITAGNASAIVDGAAAILLASESAIKKHSLKPRARIASMAAIGSPPRIMLTGPIEASRQAVARAGLKLQDIDLWEINEAFAPVPLVTIKELGIDGERVNVNGGAIALGHPLGATGAILLGTLLDEMERRNVQYGCSTMCIGLGMGIATVLERV
ncbi:MAG: thiolase family protein [Bdellovibrionales bacterium]|nr:thiolase family protein [Bdellovibrionales bacterium]